MARRSLSRSAGYLHGYSRQEHARLHRQARVFAPLLHRELVFAPGTHLLEVGCGAGAQTALLLRRNPGLRITAVDLSPDQLAAARAHFRTSVHRDRVRFVQADATRLPFDPGTFDAALSVWFLEHVPAPAPVLREVRRVLRPGGRFHLREVFNFSVYLRPRCQAYEEYWAAYNALQEQLGGHPDIGIALPTLLQEAGYRDIAVKPENITYDATTPRLRATWVAYWLELMLSGAPALLARRRVTPALIAAMKREYAALRKSPRTIFHFTPFFGSARKP